MRFQAKTISGRSPLGGPVQHAVIIIALVTIVFVSLTFSRLAYLNYLQGVKIATSSEVFELREGIENVVSRKLLALRELATVIGENPDMSQTEYTSRTRSIRGLDGSVINVAAARDLIVNLVHPMEANAAVLGHDYRMKPEEITNIRSMMTNGTELIIGPIDLVQGGRGIILRAPVYYGAGSGLLAEARPWGIVSVVLDYDAFLINAGIPAFADEMDLLIMATDTSSSNDNVVYGDRNVMLRDPVVTPFDFEFGTWNLYATPKGGWPTDEETPWMAGVTIILISAGLMSVILTIMWLSESSRKAKLLLKGGIDALDDGFVMFDQNDRLILCNKKYRELYDLPHDAIRRGTPFRDILNIATTFDLSYSNAIERKRAIAERLETLHAGTSIDFVQHLTNGRVIKVSDRLIDGGSYVGLRVDVSELSKAKETAEAANSAKTEFMGVLSHELRTPLTVILGSARLGENVRNLKPAKELAAALARDTLCRDELTSCVNDVFTQVQSLMSRMFQSGDHLLHLINEVLDYSKAESGSLKVECKLVGVKDIVEPVRNQLVTLAEQKGLTLEVSGTAETVFADPSRTRQILFNLVGNAIKFTETGGVQILLSQTGHEVIFDVQDSGPGIPESECERIFEPFYQIDSSATRRAGGTGMGLAISRNFAVLQGGRLSVTSTPGMGSCFRLVLPARDKITQIAPSPCLKACWNSQCELAQVAPLVRWPEKVSG